MISRRALIASTAIPLLRSQDQEGKMFGNAEAYERFMGRWSKFIAPLFLDFAAMPNVGRVLDVGSGTGSLAFEAAKRSLKIQVTGIDPSPEYVTYAMAKNSFGDRVTFQKGDAQKLDFSDATFAASLSLLVFNFIPDAAQAIREVWRVTKPRGRVAAAVWDYSGRMGMLRTFWDAVTDIDPGAEKRDEKNMPLCHSGELSRLWKQGELDNILEQPLETEIRFRSFTDYWEPFLLGQGPAGAYVRTLDSNRLQALRNAVKRRLSLASEQNAFVLPARVWAVRGEVPAR